MRLTAVAWIRFLLRPANMLSDKLLLALFWINLLGTAYGYEWYGHQMVQTLSDKPIWTVVFVPDSPTASLFFTLSVWWLLQRPSTRRSLAERPGFGWMVIQALGAVSSFKYGVWAVGIIIADAVQGGFVDWQDWMLGGSHLAMAFEALIYFRYFRIRPLGYLIAALWVFGNDLVDYSLGVYPWLPEELVDEVPTIAALTVALSALSVGLFLVYRRFLLRTRV